MIAALHQLRVAVEASGGGDGSVAAVHAGPGQVVAARLSFHRPDCRLVAGQTGLRALDLDAAVAEGLDPCRICDPAALPVEPDPEPDARTRRRAARAAG
jgi:hypothetical protein